MENHRETKQEAFKRLAEKRTNAVIERVRILSNCANRYYYDYTEEEIKKIFGAIDEELRTAKNKFITEKQIRPEFRLG